MESGASFFDRSLLSLLAGEKLFMRRPISKD